MRRDGEKGLCCTSFQIQYEKGNEAAVFRALVFGGHDTWDFSSLKIRLDAITAFKMQSLELISRFPLSV